MKFIRVSQRANKTPPSPIRKFALLCESAEKEGVKVFKLNIGQPDLPAPKGFISAINSYSHPVVAYESSIGSRDLREAWVSYLSRTDQVEISIDQMMVTQGASEALIFVFMVACDPGDEVIVFDPTYANYIGFAAISGVALESVQCQHSFGYHLPSKEAIESKLSNRTRAILLCNPNNPTGTVYTAEELKLLIEICDEHNILLVVDETYRKLVYGDVEGNSILQIANGSERVVVIDSLSKRFSLCGARIGCIITSNQQLMSACMNIAQARLSVASIEQAAAATMLNQSGPKQLIETRQIYSDRRKALLDGLNTIEGIELVKPEGAFYTVIKLPVKNAEDFCKFMLTRFRTNNSTVFVAPAGGFYIDSTRGHDAVRLAFVLGESELKEACRVLRLGLKEYRNLELGL